MVVVHDTPIVVGPEQLTVAGALNEVMSAPLLEFPLERVMSRMTSTMMITAARTPPAISQFRRRRRSGSS